MARYKFELEVNVIGSTPFDVRNHITEAVECWGGQMEPDNPLFNLRGKVRCKSIKKKTVCKMHGCGPLQHNPDCPKHKPSL